MRNSACIAPILPSGRPGVSNDTSIASYKDYFCRKPAVIAKPADHLIPPDPDGTQKSTTEVAGTTADSSIPQTPTYPTKSPSSANSISVQQFPSRPTGGMSSVGGSLPDTGQQSGLPFDAIGTATEAAGQVVEALTADSLKTSLRKGKAGLSLDRP